MNKSWIKLHRGFIESPLWKYAIQSHYPILIQFWLYLLMAVNWKEEKWYDGKNETIIPAGSLITSQKHLSEYFDTSRQTIRTCLQHLENMKMITSTTTNKWTQVWIVNWSKYQMKDEEVTNQPTNEQPTTNQRLDTIKEYKNIRIYKREYLLSLPEEDIAEFIGSYNCNRMQIISKAQDVNDWCEANGKSKKNYKATLRTWLRKDFGIRIKAVKFVPDEIAPEQSEEVRQANISRYHEMKKDLFKN